KPPLTVLGESSNPYCSPYQEQPFSPHSSSVGSASVSLPSRASCSGVSSWQGSLTAFRSSGFSTTMLEASDLASAGVSGTSGDSAVLLEEQEVSPRTAAALSTVRVVRIDKVSFLGFVDRSSSIAGDCSSEHHSNARTCSPRGAQLSGGMFLTTSVKTLSANAQGSWCCGSTLL